MPINARAVRLLPQPLSPTSPNTSDSSIVKDRPLTTFIGFVEVLNEISRSLFQAVTLLLTVPFFLRSWMYVFASFRSGFLFQRIFPFTPNAKAQ